ncbi:MAG: hypothetical protein JSS04_24660 [Proteobacteria bacterium]|nr:hypothetical protein [Pseudomonadota bacterium]
MRQVGIVVAAIVLAGTVGACADPYYGYHRTYAYTSDYYAPGYYTRGYYYAPPPAYYGRWDYYRHYNGIHSNAEVSAM